MSREGGVKNPVSLKHSCASPFSPVANRGNNETTRLLDKVSKDIDSLRRLQSTLLQHHGAVLVEHGAVRGVVEQQGKQLDEFVAHMNREKGVLRQLKDTLERRHRLRAPLLHNYISPHDPTKYRREVFVPFGTHGFIRFSAYRTSATRIVTLGLASLLMEQQRKLGGCYWHVGKGGGEGERVISGTLSMNSAREHHQLQYEITRIECDLEEASPQGGGWLVGNIDHEGVILFREDRNYIVDPPQPWQSKVTYCSSPLYGTMSTRRVWEWFEYHRVVVGMDRAVLYNVGAVTDHLRAALKNYYEAGWVEEVEFLDAQLYQTRNHCQLLAITDCLYRTRLTSKWLFMADSDEYLVAKPPLTIRSILVQHSEAAFITHGQTPAGSQKCVNVNGPDVFTIERTVFRWPSKGYCTLDEREDFEEATRPFCLDHFGHRKYFLNPRKVRGASIHLVFESDPGVDMSNPNELTHYHVSGFTLPNGGTILWGLCNETVPDDFDDGWWVKDTILADTVPRIRSCPFADRSCVEQIE